MEFIKKYIYKIISIVLVLTFMPISPLVGFLIAGATGYDGIFIWIISFVSVLLLCMLPYILSKKYNKTEKQKANLKEGIIITAIILIAVFMFFGVAVPI